jgi:hypothetical protein
MILEPDLGLDMSDASDMSDLWSDISDWEPVPRFCNLIEIFNQTKTTAKEKI